MVIENPYGLAPKWECPEMLKLGTWLTVLIALCTLIVAVPHAMGSRGDTHLQALAADEMAQHVPPGAAFTKEQVRESSSDHPAKLSRELAVAPQAVAPALRSAAQVARADGWKLQSVRGVRGFTGVKQGAAGKMQLTVVPGIATKQGATTSTLIVSLEHAG